jgi:benzil reductase ((S)-benzoin forming)
MADVIVWITGASSGIGAALAAESPYSDAEIVNISRRSVAAVDNLLLDLTDPTQWPRAEHDFRRRLGAFDGSLALLIHCAVYMRSYGFAGEIDSKEYRCQTVANAAAPLYLGHAFVKACAPRFESGVVMLTSDGASRPTEGASTYCAAKAAIESWLQTVAKERALRGWGPWTLGVRPGWVDTPGMRIALGSTVEQFPAGARLATSVDTGTALDPADVARQIWALIGERPESGTVVDLRPAAQRAQQ